MASPMKFLVADDHALIREAMRGVLRELRSGSEVLESFDGASTLEMLETHPEVDLVLLDVHMPDLDGLELLTAIAEQHPAIPVVMLSGDRDHRLIRDALQRGAQGFIPKSETREVLSHALALVLAGGVYVPPVALGGSAALPEAQAGSAVNSPTLASVGFTDRQLEVLALLMEGKNNKLICRELELTEPTVKNHVTAILRALGVSSRTEAVIAVTRHGWSLPRVGSRGGSAG